jgi:hypothetical protein
MRYLVKLDDESSQEITKDDAQHKVTGKEPEYNATVPRRRVPVLVRLVYVGYVVPVDICKQHEDGNKSVASTTKAW